MILFLFVCRTLDGKLLDEWLKKDKDEPLLPRKEIIKLHLSSDTDSDYFWENTVRPYDYKIKKINADTFYDLDKIKLLNLQGKLAFIILRACLFI